jgi:hypothetical protein
MDRTLASKTWNLACNSGELWDEVPKDITLGEKIDQVGRGHCLRLRRYSANIKLTVKRSTIYPLVLMADELHLHRSVEKSLS